MDTIRSVDRELHPSGWQGNAMPVAQTGNGKRGYKSFAKKYRKIRAKFQAAMKESDDLFKQMVGAQQTLRRMRQENAHILDVLLDLNDLGAAHMRPELRVEIAAPDAVSPPGLYDITQGEGDGEEAERIREDVYIPGATPQYLREASPNLTDEETEPKEPPRNPMSALSWLRKYQPQVFLQELEELKRLEKAATNGSGKRKRKEGDGPRRAAGNAGNARKRKANDDEDDAGRKKARSSNIPSDRHPSSSEHAFYE